jgi:DNA-binding response OmpR family regulator
MTTTRGHEHSEQASILIVDDSRVSGRKLAKAVEALGHRPEVAVSGKEAMNKLVAASYDIVLLDIVMPEMDGYAVLSEMKADDSLREIPVIVVSSLDDEIGSVARAIELGAEDFLPKAFEPVILRARINASLARKRLRDRELAYFRDIDRLTKAAQVIEAGAFRPDELEVAGVVARNDPLGRLAAVFGTLAQEIYDRERRLDLTVRTLRGTLLVLAAGALFGMTPALGRLASGLDVPPLGLVVWSSLLGALLCLSISLGRHGLPRLNLRCFGFLVVWAVVLGCLYQLLTVVIAAHVEATLIALVGSTRGFMVFLLAALLGLERPTLRRLTGLGIGFAAVAGVLLLHTGGARGDTLWLLAALALPFLLSVHTLLMAWHPPELDAAAAVGIMMALAALFLAPFAIAQGALFLPSPSLGEREIIILLFGSASAAALVLALKLVAVAGPVFASQMAYTQTLAGIAWGILLLGERMSAFAWGSLILIIVGFWLVEPRKAGDDFRVTLRMRGAKEDLPTAASDVPGQ